MNNKLCTSYGLVVKSKTGNVVLLQRKIPYCVQDFYHLLHEKKIPYTSDVTAVKQVFEDYYSHTLKPHEKLDYERFMNYEPFEDMYDFPHGQTPGRKKNMTVQDLFYMAYQEFQEETGFHFSVKYSDSFPLIHVNFKGLDGKLYHQYYFVVENAKYLKRHTYFSSFPRASSEHRINSWIDDRLIYNSIMVPEQEAYKLFLSQQSLKSDCKQYLCMKMDQLSELLFDKLEDDGKEPALPRKHKNNLFDKLEDDGKEPALTRKHKNNLTRNGKVSFRRNVGPRGIDCKA